MTKTRSLALGVLFAAHVLLSGCDGTARLTEQEHIQRAKDFEDKGDLNASIVELKNAVQKNPDSREARLLLGQIYLKREKGAEAEKELSHAAKLGVSHELITPQLGEALLLMGEYARVLEEIQATPQTSPANRARIVQIRADALRARGYHDEACKLYAESLAVDRQNPGTYWGLAQCAVANKDLPGAGKWLDLALKLPEKQTQTWIRVGDLARLGQDSARALGAYTSALKLEPKNLEALQNRALLNMQLRHLDPAQADVDVVKRAFPDTLAAHYLEAALRFQQKKYPEARNALQESLKIAPEYLPAHLLGGAIEFALGNLQTAESHFKKVAIASSDKRAAVRMLAATQLRLGRPDDAQQTLQMLDLEKTGDAGIYTVAGEVALMKKDFFKAAAYFEKAQTLNPDNAAIRAELGLTRLAQGDAQALSDLQAAAAMDTADGRADTLLVLSQLSRKQYDAALVSLAGLEKKQPRNPAVWAYRGGAYLGKNDIANARASFTRALALDPAYFPAASHLAQLDLAAQRPADARQRYESVLKAAPNHLQAMLSLASLSQREQDDKGQRAWLDKAIQAHPSELAPRAALARHLLERGDRTAALLVAEEAVSANPDDAEALNLLGSTQLALGNFESAVTTFTQLSKKSGNPAEAFHRLALAQVGKRDLAGARISLQKALQARPDHLPSLDALISLELSARRPDAAMEAAKRVQQLLPDSALGYEREGDVHVDQQRMPLGVRAYQRAVAKGGESSVFIKLHRALVRAGDAQEAQQRLADWLRRRPDDLVVRNYAAEYAMFLGKIQDAIAQYQEIQRRQPDNALVLNNLASLYQRSQDPRALPTAERALRLAPNNPAVQDTLGWMLVEQGKAAQGLPLLAQASAAAPKAGLIRYHHAAALARTGNTAKGRAALEQVLKEFPQLPAAEAEAARRLLQQL